MAEVSGVLVSWSQVLGNIDKGFGRVHSCSDSPERLQMHNEFHEFFKSLLGQCIISPIEL